jgi:GNAT superfamily N-acetyltransferase
VSFVVRALDVEHDRSGFVSGVDALDRWFKEQAGQSQRKRRTTVWVITRVSAPRVPLGYYCLAPFHLAFEHCPVALRRRLPSEPIYVALIARLAVAVSARGQRLGSRLIADATERAYRASLEVPAHGVVVHAKDDDAASFYRHFGFASFPENTRHLFLPMASIADGRQSRAP